MAFMVSLVGLGLLFYMLWGSRYVCIKVAANNLDMGCNGQYHSHVVLHSLSVWVAGIQPCVLTDIPKQGTSKDLG